MSMRMCYVCTVVCGRYCNVMVGGGMGMGTIQNAVSMN
jgi:hypothetical protein